MQSELIEYRQQFEVIIKETQALVQGLSEEEFNWRPSPDQWSVEECLAHLTMTGDVELDYLERAIDRGLARGLTAKGAFQPSAIERYILRESEPPVRHAVATPKRFIPLHNQPLTAVMPTFLHVQHRFLQQIERAKGLDLNRIRVATPIVPLLKFSLGSTFAQAAAHERRHLAQARKVREKIPRGICLPATH